MAEGRKVFVDDLAKKYGFDEQQLQDFLIASDFVVRTGMLRQSVADSDVEAIVETFGGAISRKREEEERKARIAAQREKSLSTMMVTSAPSFEGHRIVKYSSLVTRDAFVEIPRGQEGLLRSAANVGDALGKAMSTTRKIVSRKLV